MKIPHMTCALASVLSAVGVFATPCQGQVSPEQAVRKILETIDEELGEIDRLFDKTRDQRPSSGTENPEAVQKYRDLLDETEGSQKRVVRGIDDLIEQLRSMQSQSGSGEGEQSPQQQDGQRSEDPLEDQQDSQRRDSEQPGSTENLRRDPKGNQPEPEQQPGESGSESSEKDPLEGRNRTTGDIQEGGEERMLRDGDRARWGNLQRYDLHKHIRGGLPQVPEKYRRFLEAYQRTNQRSREQR